jgi:uncharacterized membrane protein YhiD involved in acid resistance
MHLTVTELVLRIVLGWSLTFVLGFERELRDAPAGDRTFSLIGVGATLIGALGAYTSPSARRPALVRPLSQRRPPARPPAPPHRSPTGSRRDGAAR